MASISLTVQIITAALLILEREETHKQSANREQWLHTYDYIVVGSGSAGAVVAHRLTEDPRVTVLLLEAGGPQSVTTDIPGNYLSNLGSEYDWSYNNVKQSTSGLAFIDEVIPENRGKVIGGSSTLNALIYNRGSHKDYDNWAKNYGAIGWAYEEVLPYFMKFENNTDLKIVAKSPGFHGLDGPVQVSSWKYPDPIMRLHQKALNEMGFKNVDVNGLTQMGTTIMQSFIGTEGMRSSTANSYIDPNPHPINLHILSNAFVTKILLRTTNGFPIATGVEFIKDDIPYTVSASKEVIISAGSINSPQLLMLSGIGPKEHLELMEIPVIRDLPVGLYLKNHPSFNLNVLVKDRSLVSEGAQLNVQQLNEYFINGSGPLTQFYNSITYYNTRTNRDIDWPNTAFETSVNLFPQSVDTTIVADFGRRREEWNDYFRPYLGQYYLFVRPILKRVRSYGSLRLRSNSPFDYPLIDPQFLVDPKDMEDFVEISKYVFYFLEKSSLSRHIVPLKPIPGCSYCPNKPVFQCDSYIRCVIKQITRTGYHPVGTCRMGSIQRDDIVVDPKLKVKGIGSLRVCDSSVMPELINGNTNAASIMIGEKCADLLKQDLYDQTTNL